MSISFSGVGSGLPVNTWIESLVSIESSKVDRYYSEKSEVQTQKATLNTVESKFSSLRSALEKLTDSNLVDAFDLFGRRSASSSDDAIATVSATNKASVQTIDLVVNNLATVTTAESGNNPGADVTGSTLVTDLGNGTGEEGTISFYVDNKKYEYEITDGEIDDDDKDRGVTSEVAHTLDDVIAMINADSADSGVTASLVNGKFQLAIDGTQVNDFKLGSTTDTSNFFNITQISSLPADINTELSAGNSVTLQSNNVLTSVNTQGKVAGHTLDGTFSFTLDSQKYEYTIDATTTFDDIVQSINADFSTNNEVTASIENGKLKLDIDGTQVNSIELGSGTDTSQFLDFIGMTLPDNINDDLAAGTSVTVASTDASSSIDSTSVIVDSEDMANLATAVTTGTFTIGGEEFTIDEDTVLSDLIAEINRSTDAGVVARYDARANKLKITADDPGALTINMESGTSNFLEVMGFVDSQGNIADGSQTLGKNASIVVNGNEIEATSNTITEDITGMIGVTINLNAVSSSDTDAGEEVTININQDTEELTSAVEKFISAYNNVINSIDSTTENDAALDSEYSLVRIRNNIRSLSSDAVDGLSEYNSLASIGITTGDVGTDTDEATSNLIFDSDEFLDALVNNPEEVRALLIGDSDAGVTGILQQLESKVEAELDVTNGYFATREDSMDSQLTAINKSIAQQEEYLESYRTRITEKFTAMDTAIAEMNAQMSALSL